MGQWRRPESDPERSPRVSTAVPVRISTVDPERDPDNGKLFFRSSEATTANLSRGGAYVHSWEPLAAGRRVVVAIELKGGRELQLVGRVAWTRRELTPAEPGRIEVPGYGIEFVGGSSIELAALEGYLSALESTAAAVPAAPPRSATTTP